MAEPNLPISQINIEKALDPSRILNQPDLKAARLTVLAETAPFTERIPHTPAPPQPEPDPETPDPMVPVDPEPAVPVEPAPDPVDIPAATPSRNRRALIPILAGVAALILAAGFCIWQHFNTYKDAMRLATLSEFTEARDALFLDGLTRLHDREFADYLEGGERMVSGDYDGARALLEPLAEDGYQNCRDLLWEIDYLEACDALDRDDLSLAIQLLKPLADIFYRDSWELYCETRISHGLAQVEALRDIDSVVNGLLMLSGVVGDGYAPGSDAMDYAQSIIYMHALSLYDQDNLLDALDYFTQVDGYADSEKYITLCNTYWQTTTIDELWALRDFANADELLLTQYYLCEFLIGTWRTSNSTYYLTMEATSGQYAYYCTYNLPWQYSGDFEIVDGVYRVFHNAGNTSLSEFRFTIDSWNQITVYCYSNGSTYTLYRK